jgi:hypothetical protein
LRFRRSSILFVLVFLLTSAKGGLFKHNALLRTYMDDASGFPTARRCGSTASLIGYLDGLELTESRDPKRAVEFDMRCSPNIFRRFRWIRWWESPRPTCWAQISSTSPRASPGCRRKPGAELKPLQSQDIPN